MAPVFQVFTADGMGWQRRGTKGRKGRVREVKEREEEEEIQRREKGKQAGVGA